MFPPGIDWFWKLEKTHCAQKQIRSVFSLRERFTREGGIAVKNRYRVCARRHASSERGDCLISLGNDLFVFFKEPLSMVGERGGLEAKM